MSKEHKKIKSRIVRLTLVNGDRINGQVNLNRGPGHDRVSDLIASSDDQFLTIFNAVVYLTNIDSPVNYETLFVNKDHIIWVAPDETQQ